jgi:cytochrome c oxidase subunit 1
MNARLSGTQESVRNAVVTPVWLEEHLDEVGSESPELRVLEVDLNTAFYEQGHIPGAVCIDWQQQLQHATRRDIPSETALADLLGARGITEDSTLILYGDNSNWFAAHLYWMLSYYGHEEMYLLDGGREHWLESERPTTTAVPSYPRQDNPDERIPLQMFMIMTTMLMWYIATLGVAVEVLVFLLPLSLGLIESVDPLLTRTLFWFFGHPVVYFWLMPAYFAWYTVLPKLSGGRLFSDPLARVVFILFLLLSTPVGFHHQYADPGVPEGFKFIAMTNTMFLLLPSFLTAFTVVASMEYGARQRGGTGYLGWLKSLPWGNPAFAGCALAGMMFAAGGFSGIINAGMNINSLIHNTLWVPGHFHLTVGTASALTMMAISYWLYPQITGKRLQFYGVAQMQPYVWFIGMGLMSNAMHRAGLAGVPRRTAEPQYQQFDFAPVLGSMSEMRLQIAIGGSLLTLGALMFVFVMVGTWLAERGRGRLRVDSHLPEPISGASDSPRVLDNVKLWFLIAVVLVAIAYGFPIYSMVADGVFSPAAPPFPV